MEHVFERALDALVSQTGAVGALAVAVIGYLMWSLAQERSRYERDRDQARKEADQRSEAFKALADSMIAISVTLAEMKGILISRPRQ